MTPGELARRRHEVQIVDVRWPNEWEAGRIEGSLHIPVDELDDRAGEVDHDRPVVAVCRSGARSASAAVQLRADGFDADHLDGGLVAWGDAGLPLTGEVVEPEEPPDDRPEGLRRLQSELLGVLMAVQDHFGDRDASDEEVRDFLRQRLVDEGRSPEEADRFLARMDQD
ncbi:MAG: rhodanese-like domain-containing protein [Acidimicrobiia bacterium]